MGHRTHWPLGTISTMTSPLKIVGFFLEGMSGKVGVIVCQEMVLESLSLSLDSAELNGLINDGSM